MRKIFAPTMDPTSSWFLPRSTARSWLNEEDAMSWWDAWWEQKSYAFWDHCQDVNKMAEEEIKAKLEELVLPLTGSRAVIQERLRGALEDTEETNNRRDEKLDVDTLSKNELVVRLRELSLKKARNKPELRV